MAGLCTAAMVSSMVVPVWAADDAAEEETADDGDVADISEALIGIWQDSAGDIYGFYKDNSFFGQWKDEEQDILGVYSLASDGEYTALAMQFANDDGTYDDENMVTYLLQANEEENVLELYDPDSLEMTATLEPYEASGDEADYNEIYQQMGIRKNLPLAASYGCLATENPRHTARIYAISINSVHREACCCERSEQ